MYDMPGECFTEVFHRMEDGALGLIGASEVSYSFVNDTYIFGMYDSMWPEFDPGYGRDTGPANLRPAFGNASGKYYLEASNWPVNPEHKVYTHHLFHMHGDAFTTLYSEMPQLLTVEHDGALPIGAPECNVTADEGALIALTVDGEIIGVAEGTGAPQVIPVIPVTEPSLMRVTVTKVNHYRYSEDVPVIYPVTYEIDPISVPVNTATDVAITVWDSEGAPKPNVTVTIDGWGIAPVTETTGPAGMATLRVMPPYGEGLTVKGRTIGENYDCLSDALPVTGANTLTDPDIHAGVPAIGLDGALAPHYEGTITATSGQTGFMVYASGCGVDASTNSGPMSTVDLMVTPTSAGTINAALGKKGFDIYLEDVDVHVVYGQLAGIVYGAARDPIDGAKVKIYAAGTDTAGVSPLFDALSGVDGAYSIEDDLGVEYYDAYVSKFGFLPHEEELFIQYGENDVDFALDSAPTGIVAGVVTELDTGRPLTATIKIYRADDMSLHAETYSDSLAGGAYSISLPYFNYEMKVRAYHHIPASLGITVDDPAETFDFVLEPTLANLLVIDDSGTRDEFVKIDKTGAVIDVWSGEGGDSASDEFAVDLVAIGYDVTEETASTSDPVTWPEYDFIIWTSGSNTSPVSNAAHRTALEDFVADGGKLLIEGGETGYDAASYPGYPTFAANVLHISSWGHDSSGGITVYDDTHPVTSFPNALGPLSVSYNSYGDHDSNTTAADAVMVCDWTSYAGLASVQVYDDTPDPSSGQIVYYSFNYEAAEQAGRLELLENTVTYLTTPESLPTGGIAGKAMMVFQTDHSGVKVTAYPGGDFVYTDAVGNFEIGKLYAGSYTVMGTHDGYGTAELDGVAVLEGQQTGGVNLLLDEIDQHEACANPNLAIPDSNPAGVYDTMTVTEDVTISEVEVYVNIPHTYIGDLIVEISSPEGTTVRLHNRTGGSLNDLIGWYPGELPVGGPGALEDFQGESSLGDWEIWVSDNAGADLGTLVSWCVRATGASGTGVDDGSEVVIPVRYALEGVSPNPFNPVTTVSYALPENGAVALRVYNVAGQLVRVLVDGPGEAGYHTAVWDGRDDRGESVSSGVYFCRMEAEGFDDAVKMVLLK